MKRNYVSAALLIFIAFLFLSFNGQSKKVRKNEAIANAFIETLNTQDIDQFVSLFSEDAVYDEICSGRKYTGREGIHTYIQSTLSGIPDSKFIIVAVIANEEMATVEWVWEGTNSVGWPAMNIAPTDKSFSIKGISIMTIENERIVKNNDYWDWNSFMKGIGAN